MTALINYRNEGHYVIDDVHNGLFRMIANHWFAKPLKDVTKEERKLVPIGNIYQGMFQNRISYDIEPASVLPAFRLLAKGKITRKECAELINLEKKSEKALDDYLDKLCSSNPKRCFNNQWMEIFSEIREKINANKEQQSTEAPDDKQRN